MTSWGRWLAVGAVVLVVGALAAVGTQFNGGQAEAKGLKELNREPILEGIPGWKRIRHDEYADFNGQLEIAEEWIAPVPALEAWDAILERYGAQYVRRRKGDRGSRLTLESRDLNVYISIHFTGGPNPPSMVSVQVRGHA